MSELSLPTQEEIWKPIPLANGSYEASSLGRIRRSVPGGNSHVGRIVKTHPNKHGYHVAQIWIDGLCYTHTVHKLVADAFIGPRPRGKDVNHIDGDKTNNRPINLEYTTHLQNVRHANRLWLRPRYPQKLEAEDVRAIRRLLDRGVPALQICHWFGVSDKMVAKIRDGLAWSHVA